MEARSNLEIFPDGCFTLTGDEDEGISKGNVDSAISVHMELPSLGLCNRNQDLKGDIKLNRVCEEDGDCEHDDDRLRQSLRELMIFNLQVNNKGSTFTLTIPRQVD